MVVQCPINVLLRVLPVVLLPVLLFSEELRALEDEKIGAAAFDDVEGLDDDEDPNAVWNWDLEESGDYSAEAAASE